MLRYEDRVQFKAQLQGSEQVRARMDERAQVRGPVIVPERGQERLPFPVPERRLLRVPERGPSRGQEFPSGPGDRENRIVQKPESRDQKPELSEIYRLRADEGRWTIR